MSIASLEFERQDVAALGSLGLGGLYTYYNLRHNRLDAGSVFRGNGPQAQPSTILKANKAGTRISRKGMPAFSNPGSEMFQEVERGIVRSNIRRRMAMEAKQTQAFQNILNSPQEIVSGNLQAIKEGLREVYTNPRFARDIEEISSMSPSSAWRALEESLGNAINGSTSAEDVTSILQAQMSKFSNIKSVQSGIISAVTSRVSPRTTLHQGYDDQLDKTLSEIRHTVFSTRTGQQVSRANLSTVRNLEYFDQFKSLMGRLYDKGLVSKPPSEFEDYIEGAYGDYYARVRMGKGLGSVNIPLNRAVHQFKEGISAPIYMPDSSPSSLFAYRQKLARVDLRDPTTPRLETFTRDGKERIVQRNWHEAVFFGDEHGSALLEDVIEKAQKDGRSIRDMLFNPNDSSNSFQHGSRVNINDGQLMHYVNKEGEIAIENFDEFSRATRGKGSSSLYNLATNIESQFASLEGQRVLPWAGPSQIGKYGAFYVEGEDSVSRMFNFTEGFPGKRRIGQLMTPGMEITNPLDLHQAAKRAATGGFSAEDASRITPHNPFLHPLVETPTYRKIAGELINPGRLESNKAVGKGHWGYLSKPTLFVDDDIALRDIGLTEGMAFDVGELRTRDTSNIIKRKIMRPTADNPTMIHKALWNGDSGLLDIAGREYGSPLERQAAIREYMAGPGKDTPIKVGDILGKTIDPNRGMIDVKMGTDRFRQELFDVEIRDNEIHLSFTRESRDRSSKSFGSVKGMSTSTMGPERTRRIVEQEASSLARREATTTRYLNKLISKPNKGLSEEERARRIQSTETRLSRIRDQRIRVGEQLVKLQANSQEVELNMRQKRMLIDDLSASLSRSMRRTTISKVANISELTKEGAFAHLMGQQLTGTAMIMRERLGAGAAGSNILEALSPSADANRRPVMQMLEAKGRQMLGGRIDRLKDMGLSNAQIKQATMQTSLLSAIQSFNMETGGRIGQTDIDAIFGLESKGSSAKNKVMGKDGVLDVMLEALAESRVAKQNEMLQASKTLLADAGVTPQDIASFRSDGFGGALSAEKKTAIAQAMQASRNISSQGSQEFESMIRSSVGSTGRVAVVGASLESIRQGAGVFEETATPRVEKRFISEMLSHGDEMYRVEAPGAFLFDERKAMLGDLAYAAELPGEEYTGALRDVVGGYRQGANVPTISSPGDLSDSADFLDRGGLIDMRSLDFSEHLGRDKYPDARAYIPSLEKMRHLDPPKYMGTGNAPVEGDYTRAATELVGKYSTFTGAPGEAKELIEALTAFKREESKIVTDGMTMFYSGKVVHSSYFKVTGRSETWDELIDHGVDSMGRNIRSTEGHGLVAQMSKNQIENLFSGARKAAAGDADMLAFLDEEKKAVLAGTRRAAITVQRSPTITSRGRQIMGVSYNPNLDGQNRGIVMPARSSVDAAGNKENLYNLLTGALSSDKDGDDVPVSLVTGDEARNASRYVNSDAMLGARARSNDAMIRRFRDMAEIIERNTNGASSESLYRQYIENMGASFKGDPTDFNSSMRALYGQKEIAHLSDNLSQFKQMLRVASMMDDNPVSEKALAHMGDILYTIEQQGVGFKHASLTAPGELVNHVLGNIYEKSRGSMDVTEVSNQLKSMFSILFGEEIFGEGIEAGGERIKFTDSDMTQMARARAITGSPEGYAAFKASKLKPEHLASMSPKQQASLRRNLQSLDMLGQDVLADSAHRVLTGQSIDEAYGVLDEAEALAKTAGDEVAAMNQSIFDRAAGKAGRLKEIMGGLDKNTVGKAVLGGLILSAATYSIFDSGYSGSTLDAPGPSPDGRMRSVDSFASQGQVKDAIKSGNLFDSYSTPGGAPPAGMNRGIQLAQAMVSQDRAMPRANQGSSADPMVPTSNFTHTKSPNSIPVRSYSTGSGRLQMNMELPGNIDMNALAENLRATMPYGQAGVSVVHNYNLPKDLESAI